jgi:hypothetical protein
MRVLLDIRFDNLDLRLLSWPNSLEKDLPFYCAISLVIRATTGRGDILRNLKNFNAIR